MSSFLQHFQVLMSKSSERVKSFLGDLSNKMAPLRQKDLEMMLKLKEEDVSDGTV